MEIDQRIEYLLHEKTTNQKHLTRAKLIASFHD